MAAQSSRLSVVSDNIANASTNGYKAASAEFSSMVVENAGTTYSSGGVEVGVRYGISQQGTLEYSTSLFDLAISGSGFFMVADNQGTFSLTRSGAFVPNEAGELVNTSGRTLMGYRLGGGDQPLQVVNGAAGLEPVVVVGSRLEAVATTSGQLSANLPAFAEVTAAGDLPSANAATSQAAGRSSMVVYGRLGEEVMLDINFAKSAAPASWEVSVFDAASRAADGGFPYSDPALVTASISFDSYGQIDPTSVAEVVVPVPGGEAMALDLSGMSQLAANYNVLNIDADGNPPSDIASLDVSADGILSATYNNGTRAALFEIPLATVTSPDRLEPVAGNVFNLTGEAGELRVGGADAAGMGRIVSGALENSTVDLASELTEMIEAQRSYTANSKVFQTGSELLDVLVNLKR